MKLHSGKASVSVSVVVGMILAGPALADDRDTHEPNNAQAGWHYSTFDKSDGRILRKKIVVNAPRAAVWEAWTSTVGVGRFFSENARVELRIGGPFDIYFAMAKPDKTGRRGSEGCKILSYIPEEMLSFEWSFPPAVMPLRKSFARTHVVIRFREIASNKTEVKFAQLGWEPGEDWEKGYAYFDKAWGHVLDQLKSRIEKDHKVSEPQTPEEKSWTDGHVEVTSIIGPDKRQIFEMEIASPLKDVWNILATAEGLKQLGGKDPLVELKPGGAYSFWPGSDNKVMSYVPYEMLSTSGGAPPERFPNVNKGGTWSAFFFENLGHARTRLRLVCVGWRPGEKEWDDAYDYFLKNNPIFLNAVYKELSKGQNDAQSGVLNHEETIEAPVEEVWAAFTTKEGLESWMVARAEFDLRVGGKMLTHYSPEGVIGDENTIENTILSYDPIRMLSIRATRPPAKFPFKTALRDMWTVVYFEPIDAGRTRVTCRSLGFSDEEESGKMRVHFDQGNAWTLKKLRERFDKGDRPAEKTASTHGTQP